MTKNKKRLIYAVLTVLLFLTEVCIAVFVKGGFIRYTLGDVLVTILLYTFVRIFLPEGVRLLPLYIFIFSAFVEFLQYVQILKLLGLSQYRLLNIICGSSFSWGDIVAYGVGCLVCAAAVALGVVYKGNHKKL